MRPIIYGYLRTELAGDNIDVFEQAMNDFAVHDGWLLGDIYREVGPTTGELWRLTRAIVDTGAQNVITPAPGHLDPGGNLERAKLVNDLKGRRSTQFWYLGASEAAAASRVRQRNRDIPGVDRPQELSPRTLVGRLDVQLSDTAASNTRARLHDILTREGLRPLVEQVEEVVLGVLVEAEAAGHRADPAIYGELAAAYPLLSPPHNLITVWLLRTADHLVVQVHETACRAGEPIGTKHTVPHGRHRSPAGGTVTWAKLEIAATPTIRPITVGPAIQAAI